MEFNSALPASARMSGSPKARNKCGSAYCTNRVSLKIRSCSSASTLMECAAGVASAPMRWA